jgi:transglutaminase-like putative cysteine protease
MPLLRISHKTVYRYAEPVRFEPHRMMCRPRDSHDLRLLDTSISVSPHAELRWMHDVFANSVALASFNEPSDTLQVEWAFTAEHFPADPEIELIEGYARTLPFGYDAGEVPDLARLAERHYPDPLHLLDEWVRDFLAPRLGLSTLDLLSDMTHAIKNGFEYVRREEEGTQTPTETLARGAGSCRDFALLMMEAARSLGLAVRFVSGYLYDESLLGAADGMVGGGATHAWLQVYLPGAGWLPYDPTNALVGGRNLIRVAVVRDPAQAAPLTGSFVGTANAFLGMDVEVTATALNPEQLALATP